MFSLKYITRYGDYKDFDHIKTSSVLDMIQDVSTRASAHYGYDIHTLRDMKRAWLLQGINLHFDLEIKPDGQIEIFTAITPSNGVTSERCCIIEQNGKKVGKSVANWFLFNAEKQRPVRIPKEMLDAYEVAEFDDEFFAYKKAELMDAGEPLYSITVSNKEIDTNLHMNNQKSAELLMDALPFEFYFNDMNILYKKPAFLGDRLDICIKNWMTVFMCICKIPKRKFLLQEHSEILINKMLKSLIYCEQNNIWEWFNAFRYHRRTYC